MVRDFNPVVVDINFENWSAWSKIIFDEQMKMAKTINNVSGWNYKMKRCRRTLPSGLDLVKEYSNFMLRNSAAARNTKSKLFSRLIFLQVENYDKYQLITLIEELLLVQIEIPGRCPDSWQLEY